MILMCYKLLTLQTSYITIIIKIITIVCSLNSFVFYSIMIIMDK